MQENTAPQQTTGSPQGGQQQQPRGDTLPQPPVLRPPDQPPRPARRLQWLRWCCGYYSRPLEKPTRRKRPGSSDYEKYYNATLRIYNEAECERAREQGIYIFTYWLIWALVIAQLIISAVITAFTASNNQSLSHIPSAALGGATFVITSLLGLLRTEPERRWRNAQEYEKVVDRITETSERLLFVGLGWHYPKSSGSSQQSTTAEPPPNTKGKNTTMTAEPPPNTAGTNTTKATAENDLVQLTIVDYIREAFDAYRTAKSNVALNRPGDFGRLPEKVSKV